VIDYPKKELVKENAIPGAGRPARAIRKTSQRGGRQGKKRIPEKKMTIQKGCSSEPLGALLKAWFHRGGKARSGELGWEKISGARPRRSARGKTHVKTKVSRKNAFRGSEGREEVQGALRCKYGGGKVALKKT